MEVQAASPGGWGLKDVHFGCGVNSRYPAPNSNSGRKKYWDPERQKTKRDWNTPWGKSELETIHWKLLWTFRFRTGRIHVLRHLVYPRNYDFIHECVVCYKNNSMLKTVRSWLLNLEGLPIKRLIHSVNTLSTALKDRTWYMLHIQR